MLSPELRCLGLSGLVEKRSLRRKAHTGGNIGVSGPSMRSSRIPRLDAISVLAPGSPVRPRGARRGLTETRQHDLAARQEDPANGFQARRLVATPFGGSRRPGWRVHPQLRQRLCSVARNRRVSVFALVMTSAEDSDLSGGNVGEGTLGRFVRSCR
jgi:hypothetical protein